MITTNIIPDDSSNGARRNWTAVKRSVDRGVPEPMSSTETSERDLVRDYLKAFNERDRDRMTELLDDEVVEHGIRDELHGIDAVIDFLDAHFETFPDYAGTTEEMIAEGDLVSVRYSVSGTHTGNYRDIEPTGHTVEWSGIAMYRIEDGKITEIWLEEDRLGLLEQLEVVDPPAHLRV